MNPNFTVVIAGWRGLSIRLRAWGTTPRGQNQSQLTGCAKPAATEGCAGAAVRNGIPTRREIAGIEAHDKSTESQASYLSSQEGNRRLMAFRGQRPRPLEACIGLCSCQAAMLSASY